MAWWKSRLTSGKSLANEILETPAALPGFLFLSEGEP
jgi:ABC-type sulfate transport system permease component